MCNSINNTNYLDLSCYNKYSIVENFTYRWKHKLNYFILTDESKGSAIMCVCVGCMLPVYKFLSFYYCACLLLLCFFVVFFSFCIYVLLCISFFSLGKGLILLFCIFSCNSCPFLSRLFFFVVYLWCICLVIIVNKLEVWWQYLPPT